MSPFTLDLPLKGERSYLQSADIYHGLLSHLEKEASLDQIEDLRLIFRQMNRGVIRFDAPGDDGKAPTGSVSFTLSGDSVRLSIFDEEAEEKARVPFPEEEISSRCQVSVEGRSVSIEQDGALSAFQPMEVIVAANKCMHQEVFADAKGKWLFTETRNPRPITSTAWKRITLTVISQFGTKLTKTEIRVDDVPSGYLCFSLLPA